MSGWLAVLLEQCRHELRQRHAHAADDKALRRLDDLEHQDCDHTWLWNLSKHKGLVMDNPHFIEAPRNRLSPVVPILRRHCPRTGRGQEEARILASSG